MFKNENPFYIYRHPGKDGLKPENICTAVIFNRYHFISKSTTTFSVTGCD